MWVAGNAWYNFEPCHHTCTLRGLRIKSTWAQAEELKKHALEEKGNEVPEAQGVWVHVG